MLQELGFKKLILYDQHIYQWGQSYYKVTFINDLQVYVIESALTPEEAEKDKFEDNDSYPLSLEHFDRSFTF